MVISQQSTRRFTHIVTALCSNGTGIQMGFVSVFGARLCADRLKEKGYYESVYVTETQH